MWQIPAPSAGQENGRLPLTDWAARQIVSAALIDDPSRRRRIWLQLLREEPPLLWWAALRVQRPTATPSSDCAADLEPREAVGHSVESPAPPPDELAWSALAESAASASTELLAQIHPWQGSLSSTLRRRWAGWAARAVVPARHALEPAPDATFVGADEDERPPDVPIARWMALMELPDGWHESAGRRRAVSDAGVAATDRSLDSRGRLVAERLRRRWTHDDDDSRLLVEAARRTLAELTERRERFELRLRDAKLDALKELAYGASHEINNPLANIATRAQAMLVEQTDPEVRRKLATIAAQAFRAHEMISDLMLFARPPALRGEPTDVVAAVRRALDEQRTEATERAIAMSVEASESSVWCDVDPVQTGVVWHALVRNAIESFDGARREPAVERRVAATVERLAASDGAPRVRVTVRDNGPGLSETARRHAFDPFFSGREAGRGLGFGLSKAWRIVTGSGGFIELVEPPGGGVTAVVELPGATDAETLDDPRRSPGESRSS